MRGRGLAGARRERGGAGLRYTLGKGGENIIRNVQVAHGCKLTPYISLCEPHCGKEREREREDGKERLSITSLKESLPSSFSLSSL
jgi:hypothetical protein